jgi:signal transduction histidine kinase
VSASLVLSISFAYLLILFVIAYYAERAATNAKKWVNSPYIYAFSMAIYCTAWTFYGSVGRATTHGLDFLAIYLGPTLIVPIWWLVLRKIIRICSVQRITTLADFIAARYGKRVSLGRLVTIFSLMAIIPYIAIQIKSINDSFHVLVPIAASAKSIWNDAALYVTIMVGVFTIWFGTMKLETTTRNEGLITAIAFESLFKLLAFLLVGVFVVYGLHDGLLDIFAKATTLPNYQQLFTIKTTDYDTWLTMLGLSSLAVMLLPRQFQVAIVENISERHLSTAMWVFPLYLLLINIFVLPIAIAGLMRFSGTNVNPDAYILALPLYYGNNFIALFTYLGGFAAATSMTIVASMALSIMLSNYLLMPAFVAQPFLRKHIPSLSLNSRRLGIALVLILAFLYCNTIAGKYSLVSIGLISFTGVAQFAPAVIGGLFWKRGSYHGALCSISIGFVFWFFTLIMPTLAETKLVSATIMTDGLFGLSFLRPTALFGLTELNPLPHAAFWSLLFNTFSYIGVSLITTQTITERNQANIFVEIFKYTDENADAVVLRGVVNFPTIKTLLISFLGEIRTDEVLNSFAIKYKLNPDTLEQNIHDTRLITYIEGTLTGIVGAAAARIMIKSVTDAEDVSLTEIVNIARESQELLLLNAALAERTDALNATTQQLANALEQLKEQDARKDEFLYTVTHELRTPLTSIRALSEIIYDNTDLPSAQQQYFLNTIIKESERMSRLISQVLDLEKLESGYDQLQFSYYQLSEILIDIEASVRQSAKEKDVKLTWLVQQHAPAVKMDKDKITQVILNLVSNAFKYGNKTNPEVKIESYFQQGMIYFEICDNGNGIPDNLQPLIFDKFYQVKNIKTKKPEGAGLGLAICKKIMEMHNGDISLESTHGKGSCFKISLKV